MQAKYGEKLLLKKNPPLDNGGNHANAKKTILMLKGASYID